MEAIIGTEYTAKSFKSGNSVAIRIPAGLGIEPNREWSVELRDGDLVLHPKEKARRKFNIDKVWGSATNLKPIDPDDRWFEERILDRSDAAGDGPA